MALTKVTGSVLGDTDSTDIDYTHSATGAVERTLQSKLEDTVSVKDFGAVGDGVTDDSSSIRDAFDAAANKVVYFPPATYIVSQEGSDNWCIENDQNNVTVDGFGATLKCVDGELQILRSTGNKFQLYGLKVEGPGTDGADLGAGLIQINNATDVRVDNVTILGSDQDGLAISGCTDVIVSNVTAHNCSKAGNYVNNCTNVIISSCISATCGGHTSASNVVGIGFQVSNNTNVSLSNNIAKDITGWGIGNRINVTTALNGWLFCSR